VPGYSLALAFQDFVPVLVSAIGWVFVVRIAARADAGAGRLAALGAGLVVAGGLSRATWKLVVALGGPDIGPLHAGLYPLLVAGFLALAAALVAARRSRAPGTASRLLPLAAVLVLAALTIALDPSRGRLVPVLWLAVATAGSIAVGLLLAARARRRGHPGVAALFVISIIATLLLNGLARIAYQSEEVQWVEQGLNTLNQLVFAVAAWRLWRAEASQPATGDDGRANDLAVPGPAGVLAVPGPAPADPA
jgi:hypothetical protein